MNDVIKEYIEKNVIDSMALLISSSDEAQVDSSAKLVASQFGSGYNVSSEEDAIKLLNSFKKNVTLLIEKTWVDQSDIMLKEEILAKLEKYYASVTENKWSASFKAFIEILNDVIYLMFGSMAKTPDFAGYALRIDPEFGIFWWYVQSLPAENNWSNEKNKTVMLIAMFFLANY